MSLAQSSLWTLDLVKQRLACPTTRHLRLDWRRSISEISGGLFVKYGKRVHIGEGIATRLVAGNTLVPVPQIICMFVDVEQCTYIVETKLQGLRLGQALSEMDEQSQLHVAKEMLSITKRLSELTPLQEQAVLESYLQEPGAVRFPEIEEKISLLASPEVRGGLIGRSTYDIGIFATFPSGMVCSARSTEQFLRWWGEAGGRKGRKIAEECIRKTDLSIPLLFSHGNLDVENILVSESRDPNAAGTRWGVTGVIDWECAGWYPYFFDEWHTYCRSSMYSDTGWLDTLDAAGVPRAQGDVTPEQKAQYESRPAIAFEHVFRRAEIYG